MTNGRSSQAEQVAIGQRQVVDARDAHRAGLGVQARSEVADGVDAAADTVLCLEDERLVALPPELESRPPGRRCRRRE